MAVATEFFLMMTSVAMRASVNRDERARRMYYPKRTVVIAFTLTDRLFCLERERCVVILVLTLKRWVRF